MAFDDIHNLKDGIATMQPYLLALRSKGNDAAVVIREHTDGLLSKSGMKSLLYRTEEIIAIY